MTRRQKMIYDLAIEKLNKSYLELNEFTIKVNEIEKRQSFIRSGECYDVSIIEVKKNVDSLMYLSSQIDDLICYIRKIKQVMIDNGLNPEF